MAFLDLFRSSKKSGPDESVLSELRKLGSKLDLQHDIEFFLYFPSQAAGEQAAEKIRAMGFDVKVDRAAQGDSWLCFATKRMIPDLAALERIREEFTALTAALGGEYDGWGTGVEY
jgi:regulator of RNase E activity RraB